MSFKISGQENAENGGVGTESSSHKGPLLGLKMSLSRLQTFVSLAAGLVSITGALVAIPNFFKQVQGKGKQVATVRMRRRTKPFPAPRLRSCRQRASLSQHCRRTHRAR